MPQINSEQVAKALRDAFYVSVGLGVLTFQRAQVRRQELRKQLTAQIGDVREQFTRFTGVVDERVKVVEERLDAVEDEFERLLDTVEERLPEQARDVFRTARETAKDARGQLRGLAGRGRPAA
ncbi:MAG TPA: hypothetical protein VGB14_12225 [Acidimicrobiales bacterium]|jgi:hypothetical protein